MKNLKVSHRMYLGFTAVVVLLAVAAIGSSGCVLAPSSSMTVERNPQRADASSEMVRGA
jgi:hypothetical protein